MKELAKICKATQLGVKVRQQATAAGAPAELRAGAG